MDWSKTERQQERGGMSGRASENADDSWELLSDGNWTPTCCSLGSLLMNRRERGQRRRDGKEDRRKPSCVMHGRGAKASISFTKPWACPTLVWTICSYSALGRKDRKASLTPSPCLLLPSSVPSLFFFPVFVYFIRLSPACLLFSAKSQNVTLLCSITLDVSTRPTSQTHVALGIPGWVY